MKHALLWVAFFAFTLPAPTQGQGLWSREYPFYGALETSRYCLDRRGEHLLFYGNHVLMEMDAYGTVISSSLPVMSGSNSQAFHSGFFREKTDPATGQDYFLGVYRGVSASKDIWMSEYRAGQGWVNENLLSDVSGSFSAMHPAVVEVNDSTYTVFGHRYVQQVVHRPAKPVRVVWEQAFFRGEFNAAAQRMDGALVGGTQKGYLLCLSASGDSLWSVYTGFPIRDVQVVENDVLVCGATIGGQAGLARYDGAGNRKWILFPADDGLYMHILPEKDGSIKVVGATKGKLGLLRQWKSDTVSAWSKTYQKGVVATIMPTPNGGFILAGTSKVDGSRVFICQTDENGNTGTLENDHPFSYRRMEQRQVLAQVGPYMGLFNAYEGIFGEGQLLLPKDSASIPAYDNRLWVGGISDAQTLHTTVSTARLDGKRDLRSGLWQGYEHDWNRVWMLKRSDIEALRSDWAEDGKVDQPLPHDIRSWPAKGNTFFEQNIDFTTPATPRDLLPAPFRDANGDGLYNPYEGDYPVMQGDQMVWWMMTDSTPHVVNMGMPMLVDIALSAWVYDCSQEPVTEQSIFVQHDIINRSAHTYRDCYAGIQTNLQVGCPLDDYAGCLPDVHAWYAYNATDKDTVISNGCGLFSPSQGSIPVVSATLLNQPMKVFGAFLPSAIPVLQLKTPLQYYQALQGIYSSGISQPVVYDTVPIVYPGNPATLDTFSMCGKKSWASAYSTLGATGPFTLAPDDTFSFQVAFTYHPDIPHPCPDIAATVQPDLLRLRHLLQSGALDAPAGLTPLVLLPPGETALLDATVPDALGYLWSGGSTSPALSVTQPGVYTVTITRATGCTAVETVWVKSSSAVSDLPTHHLQFHLSPNPNDGRFRVEMSGPAQDEVEFMCFNALGQLVRREVSDFGLGTLSRSFEYGDLPAGVYALRVRAGTQVAVWSFVVARATAP